MRGRRRKKQVYSYFWGGVALIFFAGILVGGAAQRALPGGGIFNFFHKSKTFPQKQPYYSPDVYVLPKKGVTLGIQDKVFNIPILLYHYVEFNHDPKDTIRISLTIPRNIFEKQVQDLLKAGYTFLTVSDVGDILDGKKWKPDKPVVLTFDDGYRDFYTDVFPILQFYNIKATIFVVSDYLNHSNNLTDEQLFEIIKSGLVEVGGHTFRHAALTSLSKERAREEIVKDKEYLEDKFAIKLVSFAYPYGLFSGEVAKIVEEAGYHQAVSVVRGMAQSRANRFFLYRTQPGASTGIYLEKLLSQK